MSSPRKSINLFNQTVSSERRLGRGAGAALLAMALSTIVAAQMVMDVDHEMASKSAKPQQYKIVTCPGDSGMSLPAGDYDSDLHVVERAWPTKLWACTSITGCSSTAAKR